MDSDSCYYYCFDLQYLNFQAVYALVQHLTINVLLWMVLLQFYVHLTIRFLARNVDFYPLSDHQEDGHFLH